MAHDSGLIGYRPSHESHASIGQVSSAVVLRRRRVLPSCSRRQRRACLAVGVCIGLLLLCVVAFSAPWWWPWLLWRTSATSFASIGPGKTSDMALRHAREQLRVARSGSWSASAVYSGLLSTMVAALAALVYQQNPRCRHRTPQGFCLHIQIHPWDAAGA